MTSQPQYARDDRSEARGPEHWVDRHGDALYRYALLRLRDPAAAEEVVQETFLAALQAYANFSGHSSERTWLVGILKHKLVDHFRQLSRLRPAGPTEEADITSVNDQLMKQTGEWVNHWDAEAGPCDWRATPALEFEQAEFRQRLAQCLSSLPDRLAAAFTLRELEGLSGEEICKVLNVSATNLWVMLHRARAQLRHCVETHWFRPASKA